MVKNKGKNLTTKTPRNTKLHPVFLGVPWCLGGKAFEANYSLDLINEAGDKAVLPVTAAPLEAAPMANRQRVRI